ncbi:MAG: hypothetical protein Ta2F_17670 [Termitinemataceae bacterium]|nr:MAG: hypothetical protein Ta2F_17670 [Termitinemataceae bacterium]
MMEVDAFFGRYEKMTPQAGDIIYANRGLYQHYGIYCGNGKVIHFAPKHGLEINPQDAYIQETTLTDFLKDETVKICSISNPAYNNEETVQRAKSLLGKNRGEYNLIFYNCEHFARWCKTGILKSKQVENGLIAVAGIAAATAIGIGVAKALEDGKREK